MITALHTILETYENLNTALSEPGADLARLGKKKAELLPVVEKIIELKKIEASILENIEIISQAEADMKELAADDIKFLEVKKLELLASIENELIPKDPRDANNIIIEMRAGAGGDESTLFSAQLFRGYVKYAESLGFKVHMVSSSESDAGGFKEVVFEVTSKNNLSGPYSKFKYESGVHRVQRVPETEKSGRVHTSTITVAVLPIIEEKDFSIDAKDLRIEATTSSGAGGQSVNTTYSAIRIVHIPTGIIAQCQDERSQSQNKEKALEVIRTRVAAHYQDIEDKKLRSERKSQIGTGDRSEKIRTYNFPQDRITDHRLSENFNQINLIMEGKFEGIIDALQKADLQMKKESTLQ